MAEKQRKNSEGKAKRLANLKPFRKGQSGNPEGRPEGVRNRSSVLKELLATVCDFTNPTTLTKHSADLETQVMTALIARARRGDVRAIREILDTVYGKVTDKNELSGSVDVNMMTLEDFKKVAAERRKQVGNLDDRVENKCKRCEKAFWYDYEADICPQCFGQNSPKE